MVIIYLFRKLLSGINLPTLPDSLRICRAGKKSGFTWHFSTQGLPEIFITKYLREPLPHIFTFSPRSEVVIFCGTFYFAHRRIRLFTGMLPYAVRTFLPFIKGDNPACNPAKIK